MRRYGLGDRTWYPPNRFFFFFCYRPRPWGFLSGFNPCRTAFPVLGRNYSKLESICSQNGTAVQHRKPFFGTTYLESRVGYFFRQCKELTFKKMAFLVYLDINPTLVLRKLFRKRGGLKTPVLLSLFLVALLSSS